MASGVPIFLPGFEPENIKPLVAGVAASCIRLFFQYSFVKFFASGGG